MRRLAHILFILTLPSTAFAQTAPGTRYLLSINGGVQALPNDFTQDGTFQEFLEEGTFTADYALKAPLQVDGAFLFRAWDQMHLGVAVSFLDGDTDTAITARVPHPFFFDRHREVSGSDDLKRRETATHVLLAWPFAMGNSAVLMISGGPTFFHVEQDVVDDIAYDQTFPFNEASFREAITAHVTENTVGLNAGLDLGWYFSRRFGIGLLVRYSYASVDLRVSDRNSVSSDAGGLHTGGGIRVRF
jgi:hypothetical protein